MAYTVNTTVAAASTPALASNPFALMMTPEAVLKAVEGSSRLGGLKRRVCRPLDRPLIPKKGEAADLAAFDREVELSADEDLGDDLVDGDALL